MRFLVFDEMGASGDFIVIKRVTRVIDSEFMLCAYALILRPVGNDESERCIV